MNIDRIRNYYSRYKPYSLQDYTRDAKQLILNRINYNKYERDAAVPDQASINSIMAVMDPRHAAQWSVLSRKRKCGLMITTLYAVADEYDLDMTATMGLRLLQGMFGCAVDLRTLLTAFGEHGRTAADKSEDWEKVDVVIAQKKEWANQKLNQNRARLRKDKDLAWDLVKEHFAALRK